MPSGSFCTATCGKNRTELEPLDWPSGSVLFAQKIFLNFLQWILEILPYGSSAGLSGGL